MVKEISKSWDQSTWEAYLKWLDIGFRELLVRPETFEKLGSRQQKTIFEIYGYESCPEMQSLCDHLLQILTPEQQQILRKVYFDGKTVREIAFELNRSPSFVSKNKFKALSRLKVHKSAGLGNAQRTMRGARSFGQAVNNSTWETKQIGPLKKKRMYRPENCDKELLNHPVDETKNFFRVCTPHARRYIYLRYWCGFSINQIARKCSVGVNTVDQIIEATILKLKSTLLNPAIMTSAIAA